MNEIDVGNDFYFRLVNRDKFQGDGQHNATVFRKRYLNDFDSAAAWKDPKNMIVLDFANVKKIGPSFANEAFAYFMKYVSPELFLQRVILKNLSEVMKYIIDIELASGYSR